MNINLICFFVYNEIKLLFECYYLNLGNVFMFIMNIKYFIKIGFVLLIVLLVILVIEFVNIKYIMIKLYFFYYNFIFFKIGCLNMNSVN